MIESTLVLGSRGSGDGGMPPPMKCFNFVLSEVACGGFWGLKSLVAEMLLHVEINLPEMKPDMYIAVSIFCLFCSLVKQRNIHFLMYWISQGMISMVTSSS